MEKGEGRSEKREAQRRPSRRRFLSEANGPDIGRESSQDG
jgi:hypothetical protein